MVSNIRILITLCIAALCISVICLLWFVISGRFLFAGISGGTSLIFLAMLLVLFKELRIAKMMDESDQYNDDNEEDDS